MLKKKWIYYFLLLILPLILLFYCNLTNFNDDYFVLKISFVLISFLFSFLSIIFHNLKKIWENKDIIIVEGVQTWQART